MKKSLAAGWFSLLVVGIAGLATCHAADPSEAEKNIAELYKSGNLFDNTGM